MAKPTSKIDWTLANAAVRTEPSGAKKNTGWEPNERPPRQFMNWLFFNLSEWIDYLELTTDGFIGYQSIYAAFVGAGPLATHATLNDAISAVAAGSKILVLDSATINVIQAISKNDLIIEFMPNVVYTKGTAQYALQVQADRCKIVNGRFLGFSGGSDAAVRVDAAADYTKIRDSHFQTCTTDVDDAGTDTSILGTTTEV